MYARAWPRADPACGAPACRKRNALKERREKEAEKLRLQQLAEKMSAKRLQRMKKRLGRTKKISA